MTLPLRCMPRGRAALVVAPLIAAALGFGAATAVAAQSAPQGASQAFGQTGSISPEMVEREQPVLGIAAIVNDQVISRYDLDQRVNLVIATAGIQPTPEALSRIRPQVLRSLIDEQLQLQEAARLEIDVSDEEIDQSLEQIASRSNVTPETIEDQLTSAGISLSTLRRQIVSDLAWNKLVGQRFAPLISIGDDEVDTMMNRMMQSADQTRFQVSEIYVGFETPEQKREFEPGVRRLVEQIRSGAPFAAVAQQFSQSATAASGGDLGWVREGQLAPELERAVRNMQPGEVSDPIETVNGFYVLQLRSRQSGTGPDPMRDQFEITNVTFPIEEGSGSGDVSGAMREAQSLAAEFRTCAALPEQAEGYGANVIPLGMVYAEQINPALRTEIMAREAGEVVPPRRTERGVELFFICNRRDHQGDDISRDSIETNLFSQQLSMMARRHLRDLRRDAVVEYR